MTQIIIQAIQNHTLNDITIQMLFAVIFIDILTGVTRAIKEVKQGKVAGKKGKVGLNSSLALEGVLKNAVIIIAAYILAYFSTATGNEVWSTGFNSVFVVAYLLSIIENWGLSGYKIPKVFLKYVRVLQERYKVEMIANEDPDLTWEEIDEMITKERAKKEDDEDNGQNT